MFIFLPIKVVPRTFAAIYLKRGSWKSFLQPKKFDFQQLCWKRKVFFFFRGQKLSFFGNKVLNPKSIVHLLLEARFLLLF